MPPISHYRFHLISGIAALALDYGSKVWARATYSLPNGAPDYSHVTPILGDWLRFRLVYNENAAFGMEVQSLLPFLHSTVFYGLVFLVFMSLLLRVYFQKGIYGDRWAGLGIALILAGGLGNVLDRVIYHKVTDFIDADFLDLDWNLGGLGSLRMERWPTFNLADSWIFIGIILMLFMPQSKSRPSMPSGGPPP